MRKEASTGKLKFEKSNFPKTITDEEETQRIERTRKQWSSRGQEEVDKKRAKAA